MELILWRHAEAEPAQPGQSDDARALTAKGRKQAARMGEWLDRQLPGNCRILASPALRTVQTAEALGRKFRTDAALASESSAERILDAVHWPNGREPVLVVGHQPLLGQVAALVISGAKQDWTIRKGSICWIAQKPEDDLPATYLRAVLGPDLAGK